MADLTSFSEIFLHFICLLACRLNDIFIVNNFEENGGQAFLIVVTLIRDEPFFKNWLRVLL